MRFFGCDWRKNTKERIYKKKEVLIARTLKSNAWQSEIPVHLTNYSFFLNFIFVLLVLNCFFVLSFKNLLHFHEFCKKKTKKYGNKLFRIVVSVEISRWLTEKIVRRPTSTILRQQRKKNNKSENEGKTKLNEAYLSLYIVYHSLHVRTVTILHSIFFCLNR